MDAMKSTITAVVWIVANTAFAQEFGPEGWDDATGAAGNSNYSDDADTMAARPGPVSFSDSRSQRGPLSGAGLSRSYPDSSYLPSYRLTSTGSIKTSASLHPLPTPAVSAAFIQESTGIDTRASLSAEPWLSQRPGFGQTIAVGHAWRDLTLEGTAFTSLDNRQQPGSRDLRKLDSRSARLSFSPADNWVMGLSRGTVSGLDYLVVGDQVRRTALSATYRQAFAEGDWEATLAWGRSSRKFRESTTGYLAESAFRFGGVHSLFGRIEQVGSDEIVRENESLQRQLFMMNKLTFGYAQDLRVTSSLRVDLGAYVARYFVPSSMAPSYGTGPTTYMMFARVKLQ